MDFSSLAPLLGQLLASKSSAPLSGAANPQTGGGFNSLRSGTGDTQIPTGGGGIGEVAGGGGMDFKKILDPLAVGLNKQSEEEGVHFEQHPELPIPVNSALPVAGEGTTSAPLGKGELDRQQMIMQLRKVLGSQFSEDELGQLMNSTNQQY